MGLSIDTSDLEESIIKRIDEKFEELKNELQTKKPDELLTRKEAAELLHISLQTLHTYMNQGLLKPLGIRGRTYFRRSDIDQSLIPLK